MPDVRSVILILLSTATAGAEVVSYEGDDLPEELGWKRVGTMDADRSLDTGFLNSVRGPPNHWARRISTNDR